MMRSVMANFATLPVYCDVHHQTMELVIYLWELSPGGQWEKAFFRCTKPGCARHFTPTQGYIDIRDHQIEARTEQIRRCHDRPEHYGSVAIVGFAEGMPLWRCIYHDCGAKAPVRYVA